MSYIKNFESLASSDNRKKILELVDAAFEAIQPEEVFKNNFSLETKTLKILDKTFDLSNFERVFLIGFGKGSALICKILEEKLGTHLTDGYVVDVVEQKFTKLKHTLGTHPLPSQANFDFTQNVIEQFSNLTDKDLVLITTCGGGSVLFEKPNTFDLEKMIEVNKTLLKSGATISEINTIRKHLSRVKGGGLAKILYPSTVINLIFSDVPGNDLSVIASAPLVKDPTTVKDSLEIYEKYNMKQTLQLTQEDLTETPKEDKYFEKVHNILLLSNHTALNAMEKKARALGLHAFVLTDALQGDAREMGKKLIDQTPQGQVLLAGGETTIKVTGTGKGGRNQALVLNSLPHIKNGTIIATFDSDGWDFYELAGALADQETLNKVREMDIDVNEYLSNDNSYAFFKKTGDGILTGKLESNVSDLFIVYKP